MWPMISLKYHLVSVPHIHANCELCSSLLFSSVSALLILEFNPLPPSLLARGQQMPVTDSGGGGDTKTAECGCAEAVLCLPML